MMINYSGYVNISSVEIIGGHQKKISGRFNYQKYESIDRTSSGSHWFHNMNIIEALIKL